MAFTALLETRLHMAAGRDRKHEDRAEHGDRATRGGRGGHPEPTADWREPEPRAAQESDTEREFARSAAGRLAAGLDDVGQRAVALWFHRCLHHKPEDPVNVRAVRAFARMPLGWTAEEAVTLAGRVLEDGVGRAQRVRSLPLLELPLAALESLTPEALLPLRPLVATLGKGVPHLKATRAEKEALRGRIDALAPEEDAGGLPRSVLDDDDTYGPRMRAEHAPLLAAAGVAAYLAHCASLDQARAGRKWRAQTARLLAAAPRGAEATRLLLDGFVRQPEGRVTVRWSYGAVTREPGLTAAANTRLVRGLLWALADLGAAGGDWAVPLAGECALYAGTGIGGSGGVSRSSTVANAAIAVLASFEGAHGEQAVRALAAVRGKVRNRTVLKGAQRAQHEVAARAGLTPGQLRERSVPTAGLDARRVRESALPGGHTAVLSVDASGAASLTFRTAAGRMLETAPQAVRGTDELAGQRAALRELRGLLSAERGRLEENLTAAAEWTGADWQRFYADHPVTGAVAGALLWEVRDGGVAGAAGSEGWTAGLPERAGAGWVLAGHDGTAAPVGPADRVRLWHPLRAEVDDIGAWRTAVSARELRQPFKQVFREVYPLTAAEESTASYSNRFAAHVLRYPQARSLMAARGWSADHLGYWGEGSEGEAVREVPAAGSHGWRARFFYRLVEQEGDNYAATLCSTDQVRFERRTGARGAWLPAVLAQVPPLVFSEAMRDVDLFVAVASIATDPLWQDGGHDRDDRHDRHEDYWHRAAFGALTASAEVRKEALARLLPRTRIADRAELDGRFLCVRGQLGSYRIHLGSGNILMEPSGASLCIVPVRSAAANSGSLFLPFEEDGGMLAVVLSKAFLLADDISITDPSITTQLRGHRDAFRPTA